MKTAEEIYKETLWNYYDNHVEATMFEDLPKEVFIEAMEAYHCPFQSPESANSKPKIDEKTREELAHVIYIEIVNDSTYRIDAIPMGVTESFKGKALRYVDALIEHGYINQSIPELSEDKTRSIIFKTLFPHLKDLEGVPVALQNTLTLTVAITDALVKEDLINKNPSIVRALSSEQIDWLLMFETSECHLMEMNDDVKYLKQIEFIKRGGSAEKYICTITEEGKQFLDKSGIGSLLKSRERYKERVERPHIDTDSMKSGLAK